MAAIGHLGFRDRLEQGETRQRFAAVRPEPGEGVGGFDLGAVRCKDPLQRPPLHPADGRIIDEVAVERIEQFRVFPAQCGQHPVTAVEAVDGDVERIEETAGRGRIGAEAAGIGHEQGMQRIDPDEGGALARRGHRQIGEIGEIAKAEIARRAQAVELAGNAPATLPLHRCRQRAGAFGRVMGFGKAALRAGVRIDAERRQQAVHRRIGNADRLAHLGRVFDLDAVAFRKVLQGAAQETGPAIRFWLSRRNTTEVPGRMPLFSCSSAPFG